MSKLSMDLSILKRIKKCDFYTLILVVILVIFGVVMVFSASYYKSINESGTPYGFLKKQVFFAITGAILMYITSILDYHLCRKLAKPILILTIILLIAVLTPLGTTVNNASRWIRFGPISIMPGEIAKIAAIVFTSVFFADEPKKILSFKKGVAPMLVFMGVLGILIVKQPNLSTALTVEGIIAGIMFVEGLQLFYVTFGISAAALGLVIIANSGTYWSKRLISFTNPFKYAKGDGFQAVQSLLALGTGGIFGLGLGKSVQKNLYLPEAQNDFISAIIGEELGLVGMLIMLLVFLILIWRCVLIAMRAPDQLGMLLASGVAIMIGLQVSLNIAVVTSSMPPTGIALPFVSYGGNTLWITMGLMGVVLNISRQSKIPWQNDKKERKNSERVTRIRQKKERENLL